MPIDPGISELGVGGLALYFAIKESVAAISKRRNGNGAIKDQNGNGIPSKFFKIFVTKELHKEQHKNTTRQLSRIEYEVKRISEQQRHFLNQWKNR